MIISKRLKFIASFIEKGMITGDIGADHGLLSYYLLENNIVDKAYASDNKIGPFNNLKKTFINSGFDIEIALKDGINDLPKYVNTVIIAGMGGELINKILKDGESYLENVDYLVLSPHLDPASVRRFLSQINYNIIDEDIIFDDKFYLVIKAKKGKESLSEKEIILGPKLIERKNELIINYWNERISEIKKVINITNIPQNRLISLKQELAYYEEEMNEFKKTY